MIRPDKCTRMIDRSGLEQGELLLPLLLMITVEFVALKDVCLYWANINHSPCVSVPCTICMSIKQI